MQPAHSISPNPVQATFLAVVHGSLPEPSEIAAKFLECNEYLDTNLHEISWFMDVYVCLWSMGGATCCRERGSSIGPTIFSNGLQYNQLNVVCGSTSSKSIAANLKLVRS